MGSDATASARCEKSPWPRYVRFSSNRGSLIFPARPEILIPDIERHVALTMPAFCRPVDTSCPEVPYLHELSTKILGNLRGRKACLEIVPSSEEAFSCEPGSSSSVLLPIA